MDSARFRPRKSEIFPYGPDRTMLITVMMVVKTAKSTEYAFCTAGDLQTSVSPSGTWGGRVALYSSQRMPRRK
jgi:hypothetical protein